ncbi:MULTISPECIES: DUF2304 domain-containing protein [Pseudonocardia]|uniref:DUF2304 domain-containing protein n=1 Tax=Pseudonocardia TaxID=1847 RepID=UPI00307DCCB7
MILQILLLAAAVGALVYFVRSGQSVGVRASKRIAFGAFIVLNIYAVLRPDDLTYLARAVGIGRGTDLLVYLLVVSFVFGMLNTYLRDREISQHLTNLARQIAVRDAELTRRENDLEQRLTALEQQATTNGHRPATTEPAATASADEVGTARSTGS